MRCSQWFWNRILPDPAVYHDHVHDACSERRSYVYTNAKAIFNLNQEFVNISNGFLGRTFDESGKVVNYGIPTWCFTL